MAQSNAELLRPARGQARGEDDELRRLCGFGVGPESQQQMNLLGETSAEGEKAERAAAPRDRGGGP